jgi:hypothetical protein
LRRLTTTLVLASSAGCLLFAAVWAYSYHRVQGWRFSPAPHVTWVGNTGDGILDLRRVVRPPITSDQGRWAYVAPDGVRGVRWPGVIVVQRTVEMRWLVRPGEAALGIPTPPSRMVFDSIVWHVRLNYWLPCLLLAIAPAAWVDRRRRRRRLARLRSNGQCVACGYDLRATPDRCPECGVEQGGSATPRPSGTGAEPIDARHC